jgi:O-methyltransferase
VVFDSFQGIPENDEPHDKNIFGRPESFKAGSYWGTLDEVKRNVARFGRIDVCRFVPGWFEETLPGFHEPIAAMYLDVDLAASTRTCLKYLYPLLAAGGTLYSQDGHLPLVIEALSDADFWVNEVGCKPPRIEGLGQRKLIWTTKDASQSGG